MEFNADRCHNILELDIEIQDIVMTILYKRRKKSPPIKAEDFEYSWCNEVDLEGA